MSCPRVYLLREAGIHLDKLTACDHSEHASVSDQVGQSEVANAGVQVDDDLAFAAE